MRRCVAGLLARRRATIDLTRLSRSTRHVGGRIEPVREDRSGTISLRIHLAALTWERNPSGRSGRTVLKYVLVTTGIAGRADPDGQLMTRSRPQIP